jgi:hypothetical protein
LPFVTITPPLSAVVEVKFMITLVVATVGILASVEGVAVFLQPAANNITDKKNGQRDISRKRDAFMQIKR